jgi:alpha/beta superfamily hydrolase
VLVGTAVSKWSVEPVPADTLVIHGELDETIPLAAVLDWARPQELPVVVIPGADHFFHRRLTIIKRLVIAAWLGGRGVEGAHA